MKKLILNLQFIFRPSYWLMNGSYSCAWDKILNANLDAYMFTDITQYTAKLGNLTVWIANHPYASFTHYGHEHIVDYRPSRLTIRRARRELMKQHKLDPYFTNFN